MIATFFCDYTTSNGRPCRRAYRVINPRSESAALEAVKRQLASLGIESARPVRVPSSTPMCALETENFHVEYLCGDHNNWT